MPSIEGAFLATLATDPQDEATRLVYADWLDERGDPRGQYLRLEVQWARLHLAHAAYCSALARLSEVQHTLDTEWVLSVSRLPFLIRQTWKASSGALLHLSTPISPAESLSVWNTCVSQVREAYLPFVGEVDLAGRFCVPADYALFMCVIGGDWHWPRGLELDLFDARKVAYLTESDCEVFGEDSPHHEGLWLRIGGDSNKHDHLLCCDRWHELFQAVVDGYDAHPWLNGAGYMTILAPTFLHYVRDVLAKLDAKD
jgi:uncharacterized protein (TIGR02996 family)